MILNFDEEAAAPEYVEIFLRHIARVAFAAVQQQRGNVARNAGGQADEPLVPLGEQLVVDAGLVVKAVHKAAADHIDEVFIALLVFAQQD